MSELKFAIPDLKIPEIRNYSLADYQHQIIMESIYEFEKHLDDEHEIALKLACFGQTILLNVTEIGYSNPSLIHFHGFIDDREATIIQHINQLSFLIMSVAKSQPDAKPRRIGFLPE